MFILYLVHGGSSELFTQWKWPWTTRTQGFYVLFVPYT